jgi:hypothetical protein
MTVIPSWCRKVRATHVVVVPAVRPTISFLPHETLFRNQFPNISSHAYAVANLFSGG